MVSMIMQNAATEGYFKPLKDISNLLTLMVTWENSFE